MTAPEWARAIGSGRLLPLLAAIGEDDAYSFSRAQSALVDGHDWSRPDNTASAAMGLRSRCDAADVMSSALLDDPMWRDRALHTGHVAVGVASMTPPPKGSRRRNGSLSVTCERELTQAEIAEKVGLSQMHVSRLLAQTLATVRTSPSFAPVQIAAAA